MSQSPCARRHPEHRTRPRSLTSSTRSRHATGRPDPSDAAAARTVHRYWVAFAASGKPEVAGEPSWPAYQAHSDKLIDFTERGPVVEADAWKPRLDGSASERAQGARGGRDNASQVTR